MIKAVVSVVKSLSIVGAGSNHPHALSQSTFPKPAILREGDTKNQKQKTDMKKLIMKLLGLDTLVCSIELSLELLRKENEELKKSLAELTEKVDEIEIPDIDADDFVREDDVNDRIESYLNDNDYATQSYCDDEIESKVSDAVESAVEDLDIDEKVRDLFNDASPAPMSEQEIKDEITRSLRAMFLDELEVKIKLK